MNRGKVAAVFISLILLSGVIMGCDMFSDPYDVEIIVRGVADIHGEHLKVLVSKSEVIDSFEKDGNRLIARAQLRGEQILYPQLEGYIFDPPYYEVSLDEEEEEALQEKRVTFNAELDPEFQPEVTLKAKSIRFVNLDIFKLQVESWDNIPQAEQFVLLRKNGLTGSIKGLEQPAYTYKPIDQEREIELAILDKQNRVMAGGDIPLGFDEGTFDLEIPMKEIIIEDGAVIQGRAEAQVIKEYLARCTLEYEKAPFDGYIDLELEGGTGSLPDGTFVIVNNMAFTTEFAMNEAEFSNLLTAEYEKAGYVFENMDLFFYDGDKLVDAKTSGDITGDLQEEILAGIELIFPGEEERATARISYEALKVQSQVIFHATVHEVFGVSGARSFTVLDPTQSPTAFGQEISRNNDDSASETIELFILGNAPEGFDKDDDGVILISTPEQLDYIREYLNDHDVHFRQVADIDLEEYNNWQPIGSYRNIFEGTYDGNGFIIRNLRIECNGISDAGLFGYLGPEGKLKNITLQEVEVTGNRYVGGLLGRNEGTVKQSSVSGNVQGIHEFVGGLIGANLGTVKNCSMQGFVTGEERYVGGLVGANSGEGSKIIDCWTDSKVEGFSQTGGLVGLNSGDTIIKKSQARGDVSGEDQDIGGLVGLNMDQAEIIKTEASGTVSSPGNHVGGLVGRNADDALIEKSTSRGEVSGYNMVGGLVGLNRSEISYCEAEGRVKGEDHNIGGLIGLNREDGLVEFSFSTGRVSGESRVGGLVGRNDGQITNAYAQGKVKGREDNSGGLAGYNSGDIKNGYAAGNVIGLGNNVGGLIGFNVGSGDITSSYYDMEETGQADRGKGLPRSTEEMKQEGTFENWDFSKIWAIYEDISYPYLQWEPDPTTYTLTIEVVGQGTVTPGEGSHTGLEGAVFDLTATPAPGWVFIEWIGDVSDAGSANTTVLMDDDKIVRAVFEEED